MAAHLLRLRLQLMLGALRDRAPGRTRTLIGAVLIVIATVLLCIAVLSLGDAEPERAQTLLVLGGSAAVLGCAVVPIVRGTADPLDPRRFGPFGVSPRALAPALALAGLLSVPVLALTAVVVCAAVVWVGLGAPMWAAVAASVAAVLTCHLTARCAQAVASLVFRARRTRELSGIFLLLTLIVVVPVVIFLISLDWGEQVPTALLAVADALALTPIGAVWALPLAVAGQATAAWVMAAVAAATLLLLAAAWWALVGVAMRTTEAPAAVERAGLGWFAVMPGNAAGAIAARSLVYWLRDRRYLVNVVIVPVAAVLATIPLLVAGMPFELVVLLPVPVVALFLGWLPHNDIAYDSTAIWMHIAGGVRGLADRIGRLAPILLIGIPVLAVVVPVATALHGRWAIAPALVGVAAALFLSGVGLSSVASAVGPYAVARPGDSPFQQPQRNGSSGVLAQSLVMLGSVLVSVPVLWLAWSAVAGESEYALTAMWAGLGIGLFVLCAGVGLGALAFDRRGQRIMEFAETA